MPERQLRIVHDGPGPAGGAGAYALFDGDAALLASPGLEALLARSLRAIVALTGARGGAIRLLSPGADVMRLAAAAGLPEAWIENERSVAAGCGICGEALRGDCFQLDPASAGCARRNDPFEGDANRGPAIAVPLHCRGRAMGVFNLFFGDVPRPAVDLAALVEPVAEMLDLVLENARLERERLRASLLAERHLLAGEVHDSLAQGLAFARMRMSMLQDAVQTGDRPRALKYLEDVSEALGEAHAGLRGLITEFRHASDQGLLEALKSTARGFEARTGVALRIDSPVADLRLAPEQEMEVYRIVQEALANVIKHAGARNARVAIERSARRLQVMIEDDGCGVGKALAAAGDNQHYGLELMRERAKRIGGSLEIRDAPRQGTRVRLVVPAPRPSRNAR
ncbi:MAG: ATP-binding protein [Usitatibacter sp.]